MKTRSAVILALIWRIAISVSTCTFFQPDEFFQSLEVAHRSVFGYGHLTWEWVSTPPIRSPLFPAFFMPVYWLLKISGIHQTGLLITGPKILQGAFAAVADISTRELSKRVLGQRYAEAAFFLSLTSLFNILALSRSFSNSLETSLVATAMCFWPLKSLSLRVSLAFAALAYLVRPTSLLIWIAPFSRLFARTPEKTSLLCATVTIAVPVLVLNLVVDSLYYGTLTFTPLNFVLTNLSSVSLFYGHAPWHYYISQGLPILLNISLPLFVAGTIAVFRDKSSKIGLHRLRDLIYIIAATTLIYSLLGHKEWRFLHPLLPLMLVVASKSLVDGFGSAAQVSPQANSERWNRVAVWISLASLLPGLYVMRWHGRAQIEVMHYLRSLPSSELRSVGFLVPCHSTPWQAYLHRPELSEGLMWAISCEPPLNASNLLTYRDQSDIFFDSPFQYITSNFPDAVDDSFPLSPFPSTKPGDPPPPGNRWDHRWPSHLAFFGALIEGSQEGERVAGHLKDLGYMEAWAAANGFEEDPRRRGGMKVWKWLSRPR